MGNPRWIVVDDTDEAILYGGSWTATNGVTYNGRGNFGKVYNNSLHGTTSTGSLSFSFKGQEGSLMGTTDIKNSSGVIDPSWECFVDGESIGSTIPFAYTENNWHLCDWSKLADTQHVLTLNVSSHGQTFWVDRIQYIPSSDVVPGNSTVIVDYSDPDISFDSAWAPLANIGYMTQTVGATVRFKFSGSRVTWVGTIPHEQPHASTSATYSIDNQPAVRFALPGLSSGGPTQFNYNFFQTDYLSSGPHELVVRHEGDSSSTPLVLGAFILENNAAARSGGPPKQQLVGAIVGAVLGAVTLILATILAIVFIRRRSQSSRKSSYKPILVEEPFHYIRPFTLTRPNDPYEQPSPYTTPSSSSHSSQITPYPFMSPSAVAGSSQPLLPAAAARGGGGGAPVHTAVPITRSSRKRAEAEAARLAAAQAATSAASSTRMSLSGPRSSESSSRVVVHQDSGLRLPNATQGGVVEHPPLYTTG